MVRESRRGKADIRRSTRHDSKFLETHCSPQFLPFIATHSLSSIEPSMQEDRMSIEDFMARMLEKQRKIREEFQQKVDEML